MADKKISELAAVTTVADTDEYVLERSGASKKITGANLKSEAGGSQTVRIETVEIGFADFSIVDGPKRCAPVYTLQSGEHLLWTLGRVTESFDDSTLFQFSLQDSPVTAIATQIGFISGNFGPDPPPASTPGLITLEGSSVGSNSWSTIDAPYTPETVAVPLFLRGDMAGDGTTGALTLWLYIGTP